MLLNAALGLLAVGSLADFGRRGAVCVRRNLGNPWLLALPLDLRRHCPGLGPSSKPLGGGGVKSTNPDNLCRRTYSIRPIRLVPH